MRYYILLYCLILTAFGPIARGQTVKKRIFPSKPVTLDENQLRTAIRDSAARFIGLTEQKDQNDAPWIAAINRANGLPDRAHYCASAFYYVHAVNGVRLPVRSVGRVASYFGDASKIVYRRGGRGNQRVGLQPRRFDAVSLFASHIEGLDEERWDPEADYVYIIGFNTTGGRGTRGGCYRNRRRMGDIKLIANWLTPYLKTL